jgi:hypothetical protein
LWKALLQAVPKRKLHFHACELTDGGRALCAEIHKLSPEMALSIHAFNYYKPDLSFLPKTSNALFFSVASVEQIPELPLQLAAAITGFKPGTQGMHFEPIGWQTDPALVAERYATEDTIRNRIGKITAALTSKALNSLGVTTGFQGITITPEDIGSGKNVSRNAAAWSLRKSYNRNMIALFTSPPIANSIEIVRLTPNAFGDVPFNPHSVLHWRSNKPAPMRTN